MTMPVPPFRRCAGVSFISVLVWLGIAAAVIGAAVFVWNNWAGAPDKAPDWRNMERPPTPVRVIAAAQDDLVVRLKALGTVTPLQTVTIRSRVEGELTKLHFEEGQRVEAGDVLAQIDSRSYEVALSQARGQQAQNVAELENARSQLKRYRELREKNFVAAQQLTDQEALVRQFEARRQSDQAAVDEAKLQLDYTRIVAPVSGRVGLRNVDLGNLVQAGDTDGIATITQMSPISVVFTIPETELTAVLDAVRETPALAVEVWDREERRQLGNGTLASLDNRIDTATGTLRLRAMVENADESLFPNQFVNVRLRVRSIDSVVIPNAAVQFGADGTYVYIINADDTSSPRPVKLGAADGERVAVIEGLAAGERVVLEGLDRLREGAKVQVVTDDTPTTETQPDTTAPAGA